MISYVTQYANLLLQFPEKSRAHLEIALDSELLQLFPRLRPHDQVTSVPM